MWGVIFSIIAGAAMSVQGVMNTRLSEKIGLFESNLFIQGTAFLLSLTACLIMGKNSFTELTNIPKQYLFGGALGLIITITVMLGIRDLSPTVSISIILISQLLVAALIDLLGILDAEKASLSLPKILGICFMIAGVILIKTRK